MSYTLEKPYTQQQRNDFIIAYNYNQGLRIEETETALYALEENEIMQDGVPIVDPNYEDEQAQIREQEFYKEFFNTSLGWIRRKPTLADGSQDDFINNDLPLLAIALISGGNPVLPIAYKLPDFTKELTTKYMESLQIKNQPITAQFINECSMVKMADFVGG